MSQILISALDELNVIPKSLTKSKMIIEEDEDFLLMLEEAERMQDEPSDQEEEEDLYATMPTSKQPIASSSRSIILQEEEVPMDIEEEAENYNIIRPGVKEGKRRLTLEVEDGFDDNNNNQEEDEILIPQGRDGMLGTRAGYQHKIPTAPSFTNQYGNLSTLNLSIKPGYIEAAPTTAKNFAGETILISRRKKLIGYQSTLDEKKENAMALTELSSSMLEVPYYQMLNDIQKKSALAKKQAEADATNAEMYIQQSMPTDGILWTDRYRPKKFTDLLGDERVHRSALLWLKEWDQCVFKGNAKTTAAAELKRERRKKRSREGKFGNNVATFENEEEKLPDQYGRPQEKIMLLCGPPGLGKTTLAYVLAKQAGYQVLEVNASDDRSGKIVEDRIRNALESTAITKEGKLTGSKPTCVVIDEIDGAGGGGESSFIRTLIKLVMEGSSTKKYKGKGKKDRALLRPIICICNDLYAPILRPLRPLAKIIRFSPPTNLMLVRRLSTICVEEGLGAGSKDLTMLAEVAEGDLRSCLNTLQFIKRNSTTVDSASIKATVVGMKDTGTSSTVVIDRLFKKPSVKKNPGVNHEKFVNRIVRDVQTCGEYEKISQGCFENYLGARQNNDCWPGIIEANDWLFMYDLLDGRLRSERDYELLAYVPYTFVPWHKIFASIAPITLAFPKSDYEAYLQKTAHQEIIDNFSTSIPHSLKTLFTNRNLVVELLPLLNRIISPNLKPINSQLIKTEERVVLLKLINTMLELKLYFVQDKNEDGQMTYKLEPPIDVFIHFEGKRAEDMPISRYAVRHLITQEMEAEQLRRVGAEGVVTTAKDILSAYKTKTAQAAKPEIKEAIDFFGRTIAIKPLTAEELAAPPPIIKAEKARYKFHEGFSNAVRTTKRVADFLL